MNIGDICSRKVIIVEKNETVQEAAKLMREYHVGDVVVVEHRENKNFPVGILTDRDIVVELLAREIDPNAIIAGDAMSLELITAYENDDLTDTLKRLSRKGIRRLPVVAGDGSLVGILSADDLISLFGELFHYLSGLISEEQRKEQISRTD